MSNLKLRYDGYDRDEAPTSIPFPSMNHFKHMPAEGSSDADDRALKLARDIENALDDVQRRLDDVKHQLDDAFKLPQPSDTWPPSAA